MGKQWVIGGDQPNPIGNDNQMSTEHQLIPYKLDDKRPDSNTNLENSHCHCLLTMSKSRFPK